MPVFQLDVRQRYTYILFCHGAEDGILYLKVGHSINPIRRADEIKTSCPFLFAELWTAGSSGRRAAVRLETELHRRLRPWRTHGEWFRFEMGSKTDKAAFNSAARECLARHMPHLAVQGWTRLNMIEYQKILAARRAVMVPKYRKRAALLRRMGIDPNELKKA